jgi:membrane-bound lytic murein transglycosylase B
MTRFTPRTHRPLAQLMLAAALLAATVGGAQAAPHKAANKAKPAAKKSGPGIDYTGEFVNFGQWKEVQQFLDDMVTKHGFERSALEALLLDTRYIDSAVQLVKPAPAGKPKNWTAYSGRFIEPIRVNAGVAFWNANRDALARAESLYGVPADVIVGVLGVETIYGRDMGRFRVLDVLTTLAFAYPQTPNRDTRMALFRSELEAALLYSRENNSNPLALQGSYAGAVGMAQFMPSNLSKFAVDFDGDGKIDLRNSAADAIGSVASFLSAHGWRREESAPFVYPATLSWEPTWERFINQGLEAKYAPDELTAGGVSTATPLPPGTTYGLVDLQNGMEPTLYWVGSNNFYAITQYNRSYFYAMSVLELGRAVKLALEPTL